MSAFRLALSNLLTDRGRTAVSVVGSAFAVVLIFMQYGFLGALRDTATLVFDRLDFDLLVTSSEYLDFSRPGKLKRARLAQAHTADGVADVTPLTVGQALWRNPTDDPARGKRRWPLTVLAVDPGRLDRTFAPADRGVFDSPADLAAMRTALGRTNVVLLDRLSRPDFGRPYDPEHPGDPRAMPPGTVTEVNGRRVELGGYFELGTGFSYTGLLLMNEDTFGAITGRPADEVTFGLVKLKPGEDPDAAAERVRAALPGDAAVYTRRQITDQERHLWISMTAAGQFFNFGAGLALVVGAIFVYQMMLADIRKHLPEYATLKAMGYRFGYLFRVVVWQAMMLAVAGYLGGLAVSLVLYEVTWQAARFPLAMNAERLVLVFGLALGMCTGSGLAAVRKVRTADPADLF